MASRISSMTTEMSASGRSKCGGRHISQSELRGCGSSVYSTEIDQPLRIAYRTCSWICSSVSSGRNENVPCVTFIGTLLTQRRRHEDVRRVGGLVLEGDVLPHL